MAAHHPVRAVVRDDGFSPVDLGADAVPHRFGCRGRVVLFLQRGQLCPERGDVLLGAGDVGAPVVAGGQVRVAAARAVVSLRHRLSVGRSSRRGSGRGVVDAHGRVGHEGSGLLGGQGQALEAVAVLAGGGPVAGGRGTADVRVCLKVLGGPVQGVAEGEGFFHREQVPQAGRDPAAVPVGGGRVQVPVLDAEGDPAAGAAVDEPGQGPA
jgi:hypothetical protein